MRIFFAKVLLHSRLNFKNILVQYLWTTQKIIIHTIWVISKIPHFIFHYIPLKETLKFCEKVLVNPVKSMGLEKYKKWLIYSFSWFSFLYIVRKTCVPP